MGNRFNRKHGLSKTRIYRIYNNMKSRCYKEYSKSYKDYGGRGIKICDEWLGEDGFTNFYKWSIENGYKDFLTIDRIDNDKNYSPCNCRWSTRNVQNNNSRHVHMIEYCGEVKSISEWSKIKMISRNTIIKRLKMGWSIEKALNTPVMKNYSRK